MLLPRAIWTTRSTETEVEGIGEAIWTSTLASVDEGESKGATIGGMVGVSDATGDEGDGLAELDI